MKRRFPMNTQRFRSCTCSIAAGMIEIALSVMLSASSAQAQVMLSASPARAQNANEKGQGGGNVQPPSAKSHGYSLDDMAKLMALFSTSNNNLAYYPATPFQI